MDFISYLTQPVVFWFIVGFLLFVSEFFIPGLIVGFFGIGAWFTSLVCLMVDLNIGGQLLLFLIASILSVVVLRKKVKDKFFNDGDDSREVLEDEFIGKKSIALTDISSISNGKVSLKGTQWNAKSDVEIKKGDNVEIIGRDNLLLIVKPI
jgi:membrane protein implicated in regulation of membrane protease activity